MAKIAFIGIGHMGMPMAQRLVDAGNEVTVYDIEAANAEKVNGANIAESPAKAAEGKEYVFSMLPFSDDTIDTFTGDDGALSTANPGCVFIDCGTGSPSLSWFLGRRIKEDGYEFLDCPVSGTPNPAQRGELLLVGSGSKEVFENSKEIFSAFADRIHYIGEENGMGQLMKLTLSHILSINLMMVAEALTFGEKAGLNKGVMEEVINSSNLVSQSTKNKAARMFKEEFGSDFQNYLMDKDLTYINEVAEFTKSPLPLGSTTWQLYRAAMADGFDETDVTSIYEVMKGLAMGPRSIKKAA